MKPEYSELLELARKLANSAAEKEDILGAICWLLKDGVRYYDWVGIYLADNRKKILTLGPFAGDPTEHTIIHYGRGICGQSAEMLETLLVKDVSVENNYLACSPIVKSEIVVPIMKNGKLAAQLDIDSHEKGRFTEDDAVFLEALSGLISRLI